MIKVSPSQENTYFCTYLYLYCTFKTLFICFIFSI